MTDIKIALVGDFDQTVTAHVAIPKAIAIAAQQTGIDVAGEWIGTEKLKPDAARRMDGFSGLWCVPASPYRSMTGALAAIRFVRENEIPYLGTCGGYQHAVLEYARSVMGLEDADNGEVNPDAEMPLIVPLSCALVERSGDIMFAPNSKLAAICEQTKVTEKYHCSFGFNKKYVHLFDDSDLKIVGWDADDDPRAVELDNHPFFIATAYQPERSALKAEPHALITSFVTSVAAYHANPIAVQTSVA